MTIIGHAFQCLTTMLFLITVGLTPTQAADMPETPLPSSIATGQSAYGKLPLSFEANQGQTDAPVQFLARGRGQALYLTPNEAVLTVRTGEAKTDGGADHRSQPKPSNSLSNVSQSVVRMTFAGADAQAQIMGLDKLPGIVNYFIGNDPSKWHTNIPTYQKIGYKDLYSGIDLVYYGTEGQLEYDLIVAPGADPTQIRVAFDGAEQLTVDEAGDLVLTLPSAATKTATGTVPTLRVQKPVVYQQDEQGAKHLLAGSYVLLATEPAATHSAAVVVPSRTTQQVAFQVAAYDQSRPLIIDPVLSWATYLGGESNEVGSGIAVDAAGNVYVAGSTVSPNFPGTAGSAIQSTNGGFDAFVTKVNAAGTALVYSTYLGGISSDEGFGIAVDAVGNAYVTGETTSRDFPVTVGSVIQSTFGGGGFDAFVAKLNAAGTALVYSTYLGGSDDELGSGIAVDTGGNAYVIGRTDSSNFPGTAGSAIQSTLAGDFDVFATKLNAAGTAFVYSTYLGGSRVDRGFGIAVDAVGNAYVTGETFSDDFPGTAGSAIQSTFGGGVDAFATKLNAAGTALVYSTYLGGDRNESGSGIAVDAAGNAYVIGITASSNFPVTAGSVQSTFGGGIFDALVTKLNAAGTALVYSTYLGGSSGDAGSGIAVDAVGNVYVTGSTASPNFPGTAGSAIQSTLGGGDDAFVTKLNAAGTALVYSTYLGGSSVSDRGTNIAVDVVGNVYVAGQTNSSDFPGTAGSAIQRTFGGGFLDAFVAKITDGSSSIPFAAFGPKVELDTPDQEFELKATFTLGAGNNGLAPLTEPVVVQLGTFMVTIPAGSFKQHKGRFVFEGTINGVHLEAKLRSLILGNDYELKLEGQGADVTGITNPVTVSVTIGNDSGSTSITAKMK